MSSSVHFRMNFSDADFGSIRRHKDKGRISSSVLLFCFNHQVAKCQIQNVYALFFNHRPRIVIQIK